MKIGQKMTYQIIKNKQKTWLWSQFSYIKHYENLVFLMISECFYGK